MKQQYTVTYGKAQVIALCEEAALSQSADRLSLVATGGMTDTGSVTVTLREKRKSPTKKVPA